ncbi:hypothetical protein HMPREF9069_01164 [Atopobium sp. oral taxon 810 str. F0209]|nr:hypothetical protein HMPREF9069_01164 [Atopobium sp. oral taxon 810 str. F0209]
MKSFLYIGVLGGKISLAMYIKLVERAWAKGIETSVQREA